VSIDPTTEQIISFSEAARRCGNRRNSRPTAPSTIWRWVQKGVRGVRLESALVGGLRMTSAEALKRFFAALNHDQVTLPPVSEARRQDHIERELEAMRA
jgi:hypothetical protein